MRCRPPGAGRTAGGLPCELPCLRGAAAPAAPNDGAQTSAPWGSFLWEDAPQDACARTGRWRASCSRDVVPDWSADAAAPGNAEQKEQHSDFQEVIPPNSDDQAFTVIDPAGNYALDCRDGPESSSAESNEDLDMLLVSAIISAGSAHEDAAAVPPWLSHSRGVQAESPEDTSVSSHASGCQSAACLPMPGRPANAADDVGATSCIPTSAHFWTAHARWQSGAAGPSKSHAVGSRLGEPALQLTEACSCNLPEFVMPPWGRNGATSQGAGDRDTGASRQAGRWPSCLGPARRASLPRAWPR